MKSHKVCKVTHCVHNYTLCVKLHSVCKIHTVEFFLISLWKIPLSQKNYTSTATDASDKYEVWPWAWSLEWNKPATLWLAWVIQNLCLLGVLLSSIRMAISNCQAEHILCHLSTAVLAGVINWPKPSGQVPQINSLLWGRLRNCFSGSGVLKELQVNVHLLHFFPYLSGDKRFAWIYVSLILGRQSLDTVPCFWSLESGVIGWFRNQNKG